ncbi:MAG TPA: hypothetical protein VGE59_03580 [Patescibacteria group bacterium]
MSLAERIARSVACTTMAALGWCENPELAATSILAADTGDGIVHIVEFPNWEIPELISSVEVTLERGEDRRWARGELSAYGWWQDEHAEDYRPWRQQYFEVTWSETKAPRIVYGTFTDTELPQEHPFTEAEIREIEFLAKVDRQRFDILDAHTRRCPTCAWTLSKSHDDRTRNK